MKKPRFAGLEVGLKNRGAASTKTGRVKNGMRSNPAYIQVSYYLKKDTHHRAFAVLHARNDKTTFSELVGELLEVWLDNLPGRRNGQA